MSGPPRLSCSVISLESVTGFRGPYNPSWHTPSVVALAATIYADRAWDRMPILADAFEEAGCDDPRVLDHCRSYPVHARGCWVIDLVLEWTSGSRSGRDLLARRVSEGIARTLADASG